MSHAKAKSVSRPVRPSLFENKNKSKNVVSYTCGSERASSRTSWSMLKTALFFLAELTPLSVQNAPELSALTTTITSSEDEPSSTVMVTLPVVMKSI